MDRKPDPGQAERVGRELAASLSLERPIAFLDLETTGTDTRADRIVEISIVRVEPDGTVRERTELIDPGMSIPAASTAIHGISDDDVATAPTLLDIGGELLDLLSGCDLAGYNVLNFDLPVLKVEFRRVGLRFDWENAAVVDAFAIFRRQERRDLGAAYRFYVGGEMPYAHAAAGDVLATMEVLGGQLRRYDDLPRDPAAMQGFCREPDWVDDDGKFRWRDGEVVFGFGKHIGKPLVHVVNADSDYLSWMLGADFAVSTKSLVEDALRGIYPVPPADLVP